MESDCSEEFMEFPLKPANSARLRKLKVVQDMKKRKQSSGEKPIEIIDLVDEDDGNINIYQQNWKKTKLDLSSQHHVNKTDRMLSPKSRKKTPTKCPSKTMLDYFSPKTSPNKVLKGEQSGISSIQIVDQTVDFEKIQETVPCLSKQNDTCKEKYKVDVIRPANTIKLETKLSPNTSKNNGETLPSPKKVSPKKVSPKKVSPKKATPSKDHSTLHSPGVRKGATCSKQLIEKSIADVCFVENAELKMIHLINSQDSLSSENSHGTGRTSCHIFKLILNEEIKKQLQLASLAKKNCQPFSSLLSDFDIEITKQFHNLDEQSQTLYVKMYLRKRIWRCTSRLVSSEGEGIFKLVNQLKDQGFFMVNFESMPLKEQLQLLTVDEVFKICRDFGAASKKTKKEEMIDAVIAWTSKQKSAMDAFVMRASSRVDILKQEVLRRLGQCFRVDESRAAVFDRLFLLFSLVHDVEEESKRRQSQIKLIFDSLTGDVQFVPYKTNPTIIFELNVDFYAYEKAIGERWKFEEAIALKDFTEMMVIAKRCHKEFNRLLDDREYCLRVNRLPSFLMRFTAASVYGYLLIKYCETFKKTANKEEVISIMKDLLKQSIFLVGSRGKLYELLYLEYKSQKLMTASAEVLIDAKNDMHVTQKQRLSLQFCAQRLLRVKKDALPKGNLREALQDFAFSSPSYEPASVEIYAKVLPGNMQGSKCVYVQETGQGKQLTSVEEQAVCHYKTKGFELGVHAEGFIVSTIFYLLFFDIIYEQSPPGVFQSRFQDRPLDLYSRSFYENRKTAIDNRLSSLLHWTDSDITHHIKNIFSQHEGSMCLISWRQDFSSEFFCNIIKCIGKKCLIKICELFVHEPRMARSGFPDLTLWNFKEWKIKFVEVKSPNDTLSCQQRIWLKFLNSIGLDCELCNVKNVAGKQMELEQITD